MLDLDISAIFAALREADLLAKFTDSATRFISWVRTKYQESPAIVLGLGFALALPAIATAGSLARIIFRARTPRYEFDERTVRTQPASAWRQQALLELADSNAAEFQIDRDIVRIGRETDNDLCLSDPTVHRYHAVLEHTADAEYIISYVGDPGADGLLVNGQSVQRQRLRGGEILEIGAIKLRFTLTTD